MRTWGQVVGLGVLTRIACTTGGPPHVIGETMYQIALKKRQLGQSGLEITRVGFRRPDQVDPILPAASLELTDEDVIEIEGSTR